MEPHEVNELVKQFDGMADMMKQMPRMGIRDRMKTMQQLGSSGMLNPGAKLAKQKVGTGKRLTPQEKARCARYGRRSSGGGNARGNGRTESMDRSFHMSTRRMV